MGDLEQVESHTTRESMIKDSNTTFSPIESPDQLDLDDAENPLQLLARASGLQGSSHQSSEYHGTPQTQNVGTEEGESNSTHRFFLPIKAILDIDGLVSEGLDPVDAA